MYGNHGRATVVSVQRIGNQGSAAQGALPSKEKLVMATSSAVCNSESGTTTVPGYDDMILVHACKAGDAAAFEELVKRYDRKLFRIAQHITHNREDAQDAVQDAFLKVFRKLTQFRENSQFSTWLIRIAVNESLMKLRKQRHNKEFSIDVDLVSEDHGFQFELAD